uniref:Intradiol ring-cleavage dioxygenases domain-containing protein n=1 Tax=Plectus sambesii TaxID=2011161 RepID=A0A914V7L8_9BILA
MTAPATEGPYYYQGAPRVNGSVCPLTSPFGTDKILIIRGQVLDAADCRTPLPARLDIWQANALGQYSERPNYNCRAIVETDDQGRFTFRTVYPGHYRMDERTNAYRPAHIHFKATPRNTVYGTLTTQLYFTNDPYLWPRDACGAEECSSNDRSLIITTNQQRNLNTFDGQWNIYMRRGGNGPIRG